MNETPSGRAPLVWSMNKGLMSFFVLPAIGLIIAGFLVSPDALTDDGHPLKTLLFVMGGSFLLIDGAVMAGILLYNRRQTALFQEGLDGTARILSIEGTGTTINDMPVMRIRLLVNDGYHPEREVVHKTSIPVWRLSKLEEGSTVSIKVDRGNPGRVMLLF